MIEIVIGLLCLLFYIPPSVIIFRNIRFVQPLKAIYSFSAVPVFIIFMFLNIYFTMKWFPQLFDNILASDSPSRSTAMQAALVSCPLAALVSFLYYRFFSIINQTIQKRNLNQQ
jgi:hypothetical protein